MPKSTYYAMRSRAGAEPEPDPLVADVVAAHRDSRGRYGARKIKWALAGKGKVASRRCMTRIVKENSLASVCTRANYRAHADAPNDANLPNVLDRSFNGYVPHTHLASDLTYVCVLSARCYGCLLVDLANREIVGHAAGAHKDARLVKSAFATVAFPLFDIDVFHSDRGSEFDNMALDEMFDVFGITRSLSKKGCPCDNTVVDSANKILKAELVYRESFGSLEGLQVKLSNYVWWYNHERIHSKLGYMSPVEFREKSLTILSK
ncbi:IS3 family transposase [Slackia exigua]|uniref:IS3 family transposase n=1 Tax=Slackia exigua TaxID=84109 RepID=UPI0023F276E2|nr:IS3 family transposase [Slackia exigua]